jgi:Uma2 family endonuclease
MGATTLISIEEYLNTSCRPDCDFVDGLVVERTVGKKKHAYAQAEIAAWFGIRRETLGLPALTEMRSKVAPGKVRIPDVAVCELPLSEEELLTSPPYLFVEVMSPEDTVSSLQERLDEYIQFGVANIWVIDPWKHRGWEISREGWRAQNDAMHTLDGRVTMPLADVLLP